MTVVLGIDPGIAQTGYGVITADSTRYRHLTHGTIRTSPDDASGDRLSIIYRGIIKIIRDYSPEIAGVESLYFARNISSAFPVAEARGVVLLALAEARVVTRAFPPLEIKQAITGSGRATKPEVQDIVRVLLGLSEIPRPDHAADALAVAICCYNRHSTETIIESRDPSRVQ